MSKKILVIDDSATVRKLVGTVLASAGYTVLEAEDGQLGLAALASEPVDLVLTDQNMPQMDGLSFVTRAREQANCKSTPILLLTSESGEELKLKGKAAGATGWLVKPLNPVQLLNVVQKLLG